MDFLFAIGILLLVCAGCLLFIPFRLVFTGTWAREISAAVGIHWPFGLGRMNYDLISREAELSFKGRRICRWKGRLKPDRGFLRKLPGRFKDWQRIRPLFKIRGRIQGVIGLEDPATTACLFGTISGLAGLLPLPLSLSADFESPRFEWEWDLEVRVTMARVMVPILGMSIFRRG
jgi:hypothetical protein